MRDDFISYLAIFAVVVLAFVGSKFLSTFLGMPDVYTSYSTGKCVKVEFQGKEIPCSDLKGYPRYTNIWVE